MPLHKETGCCHYRSRIASSSCSCGRGRAANDLVDSFLSNVRINPFMGVVSRIHCLSPILLPGGLLGVVVAFAPAKLPAFRLTRRHGKKSVRCRRSKSSHPTIVVLSVPLQDSRIFFKGENSARIFGAC